MHYTMLLSYLQHIESFVLENQNNCLCYLVKRMVTDVVGVKAPGSNIMGTVLTKDMVESAIHHPKFASLRTDIANESIQKVSDVFTAADAQGICDMAGISTKSYRMLFNKVKQSFKSLGKKTVIPIPKPYHVNKARHILNLGMVELVGEPCHISSSFTVTEKSGERKIIELTEFNNFILDVRRLQRAMVQFYDISVHECSGKLMFVLKLDESEVIKGQKLERVSLTLMNRALDPTILESDDKHFSVQSENEIWWLGAFEVSYIFQHIDFSMLMLFLTCH